MEAPRALSASPVDRTCSNVPTDADPGAVASRRSRLPSAWLLASLFAVWSLPGLIYTAQIYEIGRVTSPELTSLARAAVHALPVWWLWVPVTPFVVWMARRFPIRPRGGMRNPSLHLACSLVVTSVLLVLVGIWFGFTAPFEARQQPLLGWIWSLFNSTTFHLQMFSYWLIVAVVHLAETDRRARQHQLAAAQLDTLLARAQVDSLSRQLQPHFLLNALNGVSTLILRQNPAAAQRMLSSLGDFLRTTLRIDESHVVPLRRELELLATFLDVEKARWGNRLQLRVEVDPAAEDALVPTLLLQPIVENAIHHGLAASEEGGEVLVGAERRGSRLHLRVENDGVGLSPDWRDRAEQHVGLTNTRQRLDRLFTAYRLELIDLGGGRVRVEIEIEQDEGVQALPELEP